MEALAQLLNLKLLLLAAVVLVPLERLAPLRRGQKLLRPGLGIDLAHVFLSGILIRVGLVAVVGGAMIAGEALFPAPLRAQVAAQPIWLQIGAMILLCDLLFYAVHRLFHAVPALWRFHAVHHSSETMDWLAAFRMHPVDQIATKGATLLPCFALGFSPLAVAAYLTIFHWHSLLLHTNSRIRLGPLRWIVASPEFHHWHHAGERQAWDRNFAAQLPLFDLLFGTAHMPKGRMPEGYGVGGEVPADYAAQLLHPFRRRGSEAVPGNG